MMSGMNIIVLNDFIEKCGGIEAIKSLSTSDVWLQFVCHETISARCSYMEALDITSHLVPSVYIVHSWSESFGQVIETIKNQIQDDSNVIFFFDLFCLNIHDFPKNAADWGYELLYSSDCPIKTCILIITKWKNSVFSKFLCLFEIYAFLKHNITIKVALSKKLFLEVFNIIHQNSNISDIQIVNTIIATDDDDGNTFDNAKNEGYELRDRPDSNLMTSSAYNMISSHQKLIPRYHRNGKVYDIEDNEPSKLFKKKRKSYLNEVLDLITVEPLLKSGTYSKNIMPILARYIYHSYAETKAQNGEKSKWKLSTIHISANVSSLQEVATSMLPNNSLENNILINRYNNDISFGRSILDENTKSYDNILEKDFSDIDHFIDNQVRQMLLDVIRRALMSSVSFNCGYQLYTNEGALPSDKNELPSSLECANQPSLQQNVSNAYRFYSMVDVLRFEKKEIKSYIIEFHLRQDMCDINAYVYTDDNAKSVRSVSMVHRVHKIKRVETVSDETEVIDGGQHFHTSVSDEANEQPDSSRVSPCDNESQGIGEYSCNAIDLSKLTNESTPKKNLTLTPTMLSNSITDYITFKHKDHSKQSRCEITFSTTESLTDVLLFVTKYQSLALIYNECMDYSTSFVIYVQCYHVLNHLISSYSIASGSVIHEYGVSILYSIAMLYQQMSMNNLALSIFEYIYQFKYELLLAGEQRNDGFDLNSMAINDSDDTYAISGDNKKLTKSNESIDSHNPSRVMFTSMTALFRKKNIYRKKVYSQSNIGDISDVMLAHIDDGLFVLSAVAEMYRKSGSKETAEMLYMQCYLDRKYYFGEFSNITVRNLSNLVQFYQSTGNTTKYSKYVVILNKSKKSYIKEKDHSLISPSQSPTSMHSIAMYYQRSGDKLKAKLILMKGINILKESRGPYHVDTLKAMHSLGSLFYNCGDYENAQEILESCLSKRMLNLGESHVDTLLTMNNLGSVYYQQRKYDEAEVLHEKCYRLRMETLGVMHVDTLSSLHNLGSNLSSQGKYDRAKDMLLLCYKWRANVLGSDDRETLATMNNLAVLYNNSQNIDCARSLYEDIIRVRKSINPHGKETIDAMIALGNFYLKNNTEFSQVESLLKETYELSVEALGEDDSQTVKCMYNLATLYYTNSKYEQAEPLYLECLQRTKVIWGHDHSDTLTSMNNVAKVYHRIGKFAQSEALFEECVTKRIKAFGESHPICAATMASLAAVRHDINMRNREKSTVYQMAKRIGGIFKPRVAELDTKGSTMK